MVVTFLVTLLAAADPSSSPPGKADASKLAAEDPIVCQENSPTGTRLKKKVCMKASQREAIRRNAQDDAKQLVDRYQMNPPGN